MVRVLFLTDTERQELEHMRDRGTPAYLRERAAAVLKVADGIPAAAVARHGLLRPRKPDTVYAWLDRYGLDGLAGLKINPGRGRTPAFFPLL